jgi:hypothetical protein
METMASVSLRTYSVLVTGKSVFIVCCRAPETLIIDRYNQLIIIFSRTSLDPFGDFSVYNHNGVVSI